MAHERLRPAALGAAGRARGVGGPARVPDEPRRGALPVDHRRQPVRDRPRGARAGHPAGRLAARRRRGGPQRPTSPTSSTTSRPVGPGLFADGRGRSRRSSPRWSTAAGWSPPRTSRRTGRCCGRRTSSTSATGAIATNPPPSVGGPMLAAMLNELARRGDWTWSDALEIQHAVLTYRTSVHDYSARPRPGRAGPARRPSASTASPASAARRRRRTSRRSTTRARRARSR